MTSSASKSSLILLGAFSLFLFAILAYGVYDIRAKNRETFELLNAADQAAEAEITAQFIRTTRAALVGEIEAFEAMVLTDEKRVPLINTIEAVGRDLGLEMRIVSVSEIESIDGGEPKMIRIALEARGEWVSALSFVRVVESLPHRVIIGEMNLSKEGEGWYLGLSISLPLFDK